MEFMEGMELVWLFFQSDERRRAAKPLIHVTGPPS